MKLRTAFVIGLTISLGFAGPLRGSPEDDNSLGARLKRIFAKHTPTPTPTPKKKTVRKKPTPTATPSDEGAASPGPTGSSSSSESSTASESTADKTPSTDITESPAATASPAERESGSSQTQTFEPVRPISPAPGARRSRPAPSQSSSAPAEENTPGPATAESPRKPANVSISASDLADYDNYPTDVRKIIDLALDLANKKIGYKYNSADPAKGGMDASGFVYYVLSQAGTKDVPRDARDQYIWVRKAGNFQAVLSQKDDSFELDALKPGDLLFWASSVGVSTEPQITQVMIYAGRGKPAQVRDGDQTTAKTPRLMIGATEHGTFQGQPRSGVGVFDFKAGRVKNPKSDEPGPAFVGYAKIPELAAD